MLENLQEIIKEMKKILKEEKLTDCSADIVVESATRIFNTQFINSNKTSYTPKEETDEPTEKQINFLKKVKKYKEGMTKKEASVMIGEHIEKNKQKQEQEENEEEY